MESSLFAFAIDVADEGADGLVAAAADRAGVGAVSLAAAYHHARDVLVHNPNRAVYYHEGGTVFFHPTSDRYGRIRPAPGALAADRDPLGDLCAAAERRGMDTNAWTVYTHNSRLGYLHPECAVHNAFGDVLRTDLCPANPDVRRYSVALTADLARYPIRAILAEALNYRGFEHGYHHERLFVDLGPTGRFLLGLCFCASCVEAAATRGVDGEAVRRSVADRLRSWLEAGSGGHEDLDRDRLGTMAGGEMAGYLSSREQSVTSLAAEVRAAAADAGVRLTATAHGGSAKGGTTLSTDSVGAAWTLGVDIAALAAAVDELEILGYSDSTAAVAQTIDRYTEAVGPQTDWALALRPMWPDTADASDLAARVRLAADRGAGRVDFYHYAMTPRHRLDWIASALEAAGAGRG